jgi:tRNA(fMet)-specific endonuclease VapC
MNTVMLDTSGYASFKRGDTESVDVLKACDVIYINTIVLGELLSGFAVGTKEERNRTELQSFLDLPMVRLVTVDRMTAESYASIYLMLRKRGTPIPTNDMWIAACATQHTASVFTFDAHFKEIEALKSGSTRRDLQLI